MDDLKYCVKIGDISIRVEDISTDDMPNQVFKDIAEICGMETACKLLTNFQGNLIQVPTRGFVNIEKKIILAGYDYSTQSIRVLARKLIVSEKYIRDVLKRSGIDAPVEGQIPAFIKQDGNYVPNLMKTGSEAG